MNLDNLDFKTTDPSGFLSDIDGLPDQVDAAWALGQTRELPESYREVKRIVVCGMGGSAIGGSLVQALVESESRVPLTVLRDYALPQFAAGPETLVIGSSHSGNTEETLAAFEQAHARGARLLAISRGGTLMESAERWGASAWQFEHAGQPRAAVGYSMMLLLAVLARLGLVRYNAGHIAEAVAEMRTQQKIIAADVPVVHNPAKRLAGQLMDRYTVVFGSGYFAPVARRWKGQIGEVSKAWAQFEELPEADHNTVVGTMYPEQLIGKFMMLFLRSSFEHVRNAARADATKELLMTLGFNTDNVQAMGVSPLAQMLTALHFGDYTSYYLAMCYGVDPTPIPQIDTLKARLAQLQ